MNSENKRNRFSWSTDPKLDQQLKQRIRRNNIFAIVVIIIIVAALMYK